MIKQILLLIVVIFIIVTFNIYAGSLTVDNMTITP